jgi:hypothetical protein
MKQNLPHLERHGRRKTTRSSANQHFLLAMMDDRHEAPKALEITRNLLQDFISAPAGDIGPLSGHFDFAESPLLSRLLMTGYTTNCR